MLLTRKASGTAAQQSRLARGLSGVLAKTMDRRAFLRALARGPKKGGQQVYLNPYFTTSQKADENGQKMVTFSATVDLSSAAFSGRFQPAGGTVTP